MNFLVLATFIYFVIWLNFTLHRIAIKKGKLEKSYWEKEIMSNSVRKKSLDGLDYISIPMDKLPFGVLTDQSEVSECETVLKELSGEKIVNLTGISNTDLKLMYGTANITPLSAYDQNYTTLVCTLQKWAQILFDAAYYTEAATVLEFALSTGTDIQASYRLLARLYQSRLSLSEEEFRERIGSMTETASKLRSLSKTPILQYLQDLLEEEGQISFK
jgi:hypothetical protein